MTRMIPNHESSLPSRIRDLEVQRRNAVVRKDWTTASELSTRVAELKAELHQALKPNIRRMSEEEIAAADTRMKDRRRWWTTARSSA